MSSRKFWENGDTSDDFLLTARIKMWLPKRKIFTSSVKRFLKMPLSPKNDLEVEISQTRSSVNVPDFPNSPFNKTGTKIEILAKF